MSDADKHTGADSESNAALEKAAMQDAHMQDVHAQLMREKDEPHEGFSPIPIFLIFAFSALCFWGGVYLVGNEARFRWDVFDPDFKDVPPVVVEIPLAERGAKVYQKQCLQCHQATGIGVPGAFPPLVESRWVTGSEERVVRILLNGLNGPVEVAGNTYNGNMPAFGPNGLNLKSRDIAAVLTYIRQEWGNGAPEISIEAIEAYIAKYAGRSKPWTAEELLADFPME